jgi:hypothetical protein
VTLTHPDDDWAPARGTAYVTPAEAEAYFEGSWTGEGEIVGRGLLRWLMPREPFRPDVTMERLSESIWVFRDHLVFARGGEIRRTQFMERVGVGRYRATADDMPLGADVVVEDRRYRYEEYRSWMRFRGRMFRVRGARGRFALRGRQHRGRDLRVVARDAAVADAAAPSPGLTCGLARSRSCGRSSCSQGQVCRKRRPRAHG